MTYIVILSLYLVSVPLIIYLYVVDEAGSTVSKQIVKTEPGVPTPNQPHSMHARSVGVPQTKLEIRQYYLDSKYLLILNLCKR